VGNSGAQERKTEKMGQDITGIKMIWISEKLIKVLARLERIRYVLDSNKGKMNSNHYQAAMADLLTINDLITWILLRFMSALEIDVAVREEVTKYEHIKRG
jgi:hypothetical protein